ncbi:CAP domain-containing protein [Bacillus solitudinis]|uniref:CAP domain-containing protein n=1 Tax=Bacillus solitudinis TaxID=2014074 RepID=UPI000C23CF60|nr:CAP domain-containing protein [Bacillus solitudinis]
MKKIITITLLSTIVFTGFWGQADAAKPESSAWNVQQKIVYVQSENSKQLFKLEDFINEMSKVHQLKIKNGKLAYETAQEEKVEQPKEKQQVESTQPVQQPTTTERYDQQVSSLTEVEQQMIDLVNQERQKQGLVPLKVNLELTKVARIKADDMISNNYFSHQSPTYGSPFDMLGKYGVEYRTAGENLAGNQTVDAAHTTLMNSEGHRANILSSEYSEIGIGVVDGSPYGKIFVQLFKG